MSHKRQIPMGFELEDLPAPDRVARPRPERPVPATPRSANPFLEDAPQAAPGRSPRVERRESKPSVATPTPTVEPVAQSEATPTKQPDAKPRKRALSEELSVVAESLSEDGLLLAKRFPDVLNAFSAGGALSGEIPGFCARSQQVEMALSIAKSLDQHSVLVAEAGTGTGKTFAYLVPALLAGGRVVVSTGTKTLQDQLFNRDLPTVRAALKRPITTALLKGRANYVCHYHLERSSHDGRFHAREDVQYLRQIQKFAKVSETGDKAECVGVPEDATVWSAVTSSRDNCLGQECPNHKECFVLKARKTALEADVVVVNHHLFFADVVLRDEGAGELLPAANAVIFDEAHQLPETATAFFGESVTTSQLVELARDTRLESAGVEGGFAPMIEATRTLEKAAKDVRLAFGRENARYNADDLDSNARLQEALEILQGALSGFAALVETQAERSEGLENCWRRTIEIQEALKRWLALGKPADGKAPAKSEAKVRWAETYSQSASLNLTPLHVAELFRKSLDGGHPKAWIFASATLAIGRDFSHYCQELGLWPLPLGESLAVGQEITEAGDSVPAETRVWGSPFNYGEQAVLYAPPGMPDPNSMGYNEAVVARSIPLIEASQGRCFILCTSLKAMRRIHELLVEAFAKRDWEFPLLVQGQASRGELLERFRQAGNAVLVASQSFWEGVDVPGDALSLVIIDKLPFAPPDDPVLAARIEHLRDQGGNPFMDYQLPRAVISMKQGAGRLIRTERDRGVLVICDPRMIVKPYGRRVWQSLPPMRRSKEEGEVVAFLHSLRTETVAEQL